MNIIADTCFWISLCDPTDNHHDECVQIFEKICNNKQHHIIVPHPVLYETLRTGIVKMHKNALTLIDYYFAKAERQSDIPYLDEAYQFVRNQSLLSNGSTSMVDAVIMIMAERKENNIIAVLTLNHRDFSKFCQSNRIKMIDSLAMFDAL